MVKRVYFQAYFLGVMALGTGLWVFHLHGGGTGAAEEAKGKGAFQTLEEIEKQLQEQYSQVQSSEEARLYVQKDFVGLHKRILEDKNVRNTIGKVFEAGVHLMDRGALTKSWTPEDFQRLYSMIVDLMWERRDHFQGRDAHMLTVGMRLLSKLPEPTGASNDRARLIEFLDAPSEDLKQAALGVVERWVPLPSEAADQIRERMMSREPGAARIGLGYVPNVKDDHARVALFNDMVANYRKLAEPIRPLALKIWVDYRKLIKAAPDDAIRTASESDDDDWRDAVVYAIERGAVAYPPYTAYLVKLRRDNTDPIMKMRLAQLFGRIPASAFGGTADGGSK
jgi:hypothetical protein